MAERLDLLRLLARLPRRQQEVFVLRYVEDRSEAEVGAVLGCSSGTVKRHAWRASRALRALHSSDNRADPLAPSPTTEGT